MAPYLTYYILINVSCYYSLAATKNMVILRFSCDQKHGNIKIAKHKVCFLKNGLLKTMCILLLKGDLLCLIQTDKVLFRYQKIIHINLLRGNITNIC